MPAIKVKLFPVIWLIFTGVLLNILSFYRNGFPVLSSLSNLILTMSLFLILIIIFKEFNSVFIRLLKKLIGIIKLKNRNTNVEKENVSLHKDTLDDSDLIEIKKKNISDAVLTNVSPERRVCEVLFVISFLGLAFWRLSGIFKVMPFSINWQYRSNITDAILLFIFPCVSLLYLKIVKKSNNNADKISKDLLLLLSNVSFVYAAIIAITSVLNLNVIIILQWFFYLVMLYLVIVLFFNILLSILKGEILNFNYSLFPKISYKDSQDEKWIISFKSLYTLRYAFKIMPAFFLVFIFIMFLSTSFYIVQPHQQAAVYRFGKLNESSIKNEGLHLKFPWPIDKTEIFDVHRVSSMQIGYESSGSSNFLWGQMHDGGEYLLLLGNGNEMAAVNLKILYVISDLLSYLKTSADPEMLLAAKAYNALMNRTINTTLDSFLNVDRKSLSVSVLDELSEYCKSENLGFSVVQVIIESIHPPVEVASIYQRVVSASVDKTTSIIKANTAAETEIIRAQRQSKNAIDDSRAKQYNRVSEAQKEMAIFYAAMEASRISSGSYELAKQLEVYEKIIKKNKVYVFTPGTQNHISKFIIGNTGISNILEVNRGAGNE